MHPEIRHGKHSAERASRIHHFHRARCVRPQSPHFLYANLFNTAVDPNAPPPKRKPGRPKGSGKKPPPDPTIITERIKRPVGRPRKDGLPAGSVGARRANQLRRSSAKMSTEAPQLPPGIPFAGVRGRTPLFKVAVVLILDG
jgi:hypothetical protein